MFLLNKSKTGPINKPKIISNVDEFYETFGKMETLLELRNKKIKKILNRNYGNR